MNTNHQMFQGRIQNGHPYAARQRLALQTVQGCGGRGRSFTGDRPHSPTEAGTFRRLMEDQLGVSLLLTYRGAAVMEGQLGVSS